MGIIRRSLVLIVGGAFLWALPKAYGQENQYPQEMVDACATMNAAGEDDCENAPEHIVTHCYADKRAADIKDADARNKLGVQSEPGKYCFAYYETRPCGSFFKLVAGGKPVIVSCEEMLAAVVQRNAECGDCLELVTRDPAYTPTDPQDEEEASTQEQEEASIAQEESQIHQRALNNSLDYSRFMQQSSLSAQPGSRVVQEGSQAGQEGSQAGQEGSQEGQQGSQDGQQGSLEEQGK
jgi:hypothetical protein